MALLGKAVNPPKGMDPNSNPYAYNDYARRLILSTAVRRLTPINTQVFGTGNILGNVINVPLRNVGLVMGYYIRVDVTFARSAAETQTLQPLGAANVLSQIILTDLSNNQRIQTAGWHLNLMDTVRKRLRYGNASPFGAAATIGNYPIDYGENYNVISAPTSFTTGTQTMRMWYYVPLAYSDYDLRGAIFASVVNATFNLQFTFNQQFSVISTADGTLACYKSSSTDLIVPSALTVTTYQDYYDQLPQGNNAPILPVLDLGVAYRLNNTFQSGLLVNQDFAIPYPNFQQFMSTALIYDNNGTLNAGTDVAYFALETANYTRVWQRDPILATLISRNLMFDDPPAGMYYFDYRDRPVSTDQFGNQQLLINPSTVTSGTGSVLLLGFESLQIINQVSQAGSLIAGG